MFDANGVICTDIHKASLEILSSDEVLKMSVARIHTTTTFLGSSPVKGGLHDPAMGFLDFRSPCVTCGLRRDCPGHLGHIEFPVLMCHPTLLGSLVRLLKLVCFRCKRLKVDQRTANVYVKKFQLVQSGMLEYGGLFDNLHAATAAQDQLSRSLKKKDAAPSESTSQNKESKRLQLVELLSRLREKETQRKALCQSLEGDISETHTAFESWTTLRQEFVKVAMSRSSCSHCGQSYYVHLKESPGGTAIELTWPWGSTNPLEGLIWPVQKFIVSKEVTQLSPSGEEMPLDQIIQLEQNMIHGRRGRVMGSVELLSGHLCILLEALWNSPDRFILEFLYPMSLKHGWEMFFIHYFPVSSNRFRPVSQAPAFASGASGNKYNASSQQTILHTRTLGLLDILTASNSLQDTIDTLFKKTLEEKDWNETKYFVQQLNQRCKELQQYVNQYIDNNKTLGAKGKTVVPGLRQWIEKKEGAIRQKMMGKRVNHVARTVVAPDNCINTNEVGIPLDFAMKLTLPEYVTAQSAGALAKLVERGAHMYPGANMIEDSNGNVYDLAVMSKEMRLTKVRSFFSNVTEDGPPKIVYRHLRNGDIVVMNRQPTLHRASLMAHFIRVLPGWKTFRLMYVNCGSYNADFDGDEMNMHLPQDPTSRLEAKLILNADCQYITAKNGEPLRGLIQDHVLGGTFLTCRNTFLNKNQYYTLVYCGLGSFVDSAQAMSLLPDSGHDGVVDALRNAGDDGLNDSFHNAALHQVKECLAIHIEGPALIKPLPRWTGKQVITTILKTVVDTMARRQFSHDDEFCKTFDGIHFTAQSKTPGDAWGGVLDGDCEESTLIISQSELLQGVFDKSMIGASSFGLIHYCYELLGASVAGILLSVFAKTFTCYLQMRGFSCCTGDFLMTPVGKLNRAKMIRRCILAGNYAQEILIDSIQREMGWSENPMTNTSWTKKVQKAHSALLNSERKCHLFQEEISELKNSSLKKKKNSGDSASPCFGLTQKSSSLKFETKEDFVKSLTSLPFHSDDEAREKAVKKNVSIKSCEHLTSPTVFSILPHEGDDTFSLWDKIRFLRFPYQYGEGFNEGCKDKMVRQRETLVNQFVNIFKTNSRIARAIILELMKSSQFGFYFPNVTKLLGAHHVWGQSYEILHGDTVPKHPTPRLFDAKPDPCTTSSLLGCPQPNRSWILPNGRLMTGDGSKRMPQLYHPSWLYMHEHGFDFEDPQRYVKKWLFDETSLTHRFESTRRSKGKPFCLTPNFVTRQRLEHLALHHFIGREASLISTMDGFFQAVMGRLTSQNNDLVSGHSILYKFPHNGFASMITTGAKGSKVNFAMISGMLSQQSLEGRRVPVMVSGKTLPSFGFYDFGTRAGGLITDCYLHGLRPQEYFFHCMAGREGLVDTAVKTARSGYLQRCVMKGMEGILVQYDGTVRDSDGTIIQFLYGEDGLDVSKASYHKMLEDLLQNPALVKVRYASAIKLSLSKIEKSLRAIKQFNRHSKPCGHPSTLHPQDQDPLSNIFSPISHVGSTSEKYYQQVKRLIRTDPHQFISQHLRENLTTTPSKDSKDGQNPHVLRRNAKKLLKQILLLKYSQALCCPGEAVGCISAQSMGEPATQMTLNTFHLAGHGAANVTLGIPRLKEILQTAGATKTPMIYAPVKGESNEQAALHAEKALLGLQRIPLTDVIHAIGVESNIYVEVNVGSTMSVMEMGYVFGVC